jgi:hypothetical protein
VSDLPDRVRDAVPVVIRNLKPRRWPTMVMRLCLLCAGISCLLAIVATSNGVPHNVVLLLAAPAGLGVVGAVGFAIALLVHQPIEKVVLGVWLETWPGKTRYQVRDVVQIEFVSGPEDDYADTNLALPSRDVGIALNATFRFRPMRLTITGADAARLSEWATRKGIPLVGADGIRS